MAEQHEKKQSLGERLFMLRNENNMTQEDLAERLNVSRQSISKWELDKTLPDIEKLIQLSDLYHISLDYLIKGIVQTDCADHATHAVPIESTGETADSAPEQQDALQPLEIALQSEKKHSQIVLIKQVFFLLCALISGLLCLFMLSFSGKMLYQHESLHHHSEQEVIRVDKIYTQYTKAELSGVTKDGDFFQKIAWLDIPGVRENDYIFSYQDTEHPGTVYFDYYLQTLVLPVIIGILMLIFCIVFFIGWINTRAYEKEIIYEEKT